MVTMEGRWSAVPNPVTEGCRKIATFARIMLPARGEGPVVVAAVVVALWLLATWVIDQYIAPKLDTYVQAVFPHHHPRVTLPRSGAVRLLVVKLVACSVLAMIIPDLKHAPLLVATILSFWLTAVCRPRWVKNLVVYLVPALFIANTYHTAPNVPIEVIVVLILLRGVCGTVHCVSPNLVLWSDLAFVVGYWSYCLRGRPVAKAGLYAAMTTATLHFLGVTPNSAAVRFHGARLSELDSDVRTAVAMVVLSVVVACVPLILQTGWVILSISVHYTFLWWFPPSQIRVAKTAVQCAACMLIAVSLFTTAVTQGELRLLSLVICTCLVVCPTERTVRWILWLLPCGIWLRIYQRVGYFFPQSSIAQVLFAVQVSAQIPFSVLVNMEILTICTTQFVMLVMIGAFSERWLCCQCCAASILMIGVVYGTQIFNRIMQRVERFWGMLCWFWKPHIHGIATVLVGAIPLWGAPLLNALALIPPLAVYGVLIGAHIGLFLFTKCYKPYDISNPTRNAQLVSFVAVIFVVYEVAAINWGAQQHDTGAHISLVLLPFIFVTHLFNDPFSCMVKFVHLIPLLFELQRIFGLVIREDHSLDDLVDFGGRPWYITMARCGYGFPIFLHFLGISMLEMAMLSACRVAFFYACGSPQVTVRAIAFGFGLLLRLYLRVSTELSDEKGRFIAAERENKLRRAVTVAEMAQARAELERERACREKAEVVAELEAIKACNSLRISFPEWDRVSRQKGALIAMAYQRLHPKDLKSLKLKHMHFEHFQLNLELGGGGFCTVWSGTLRNSPVAVKAISASNKLNMNAVGSLVNEIMTHARLEHPFIVQFMGYCWDPCVCLVMELAPKGNLAELLGCSNVQLTWGHSLLTLAMQLTSSLAYLHGLAQQTVHTDVKPRNLLMWDINNLKLADFGLSRVFPQPSTSLDSCAHGVAGSGRYIPPEVRLGLGITPASDIWSYGVTLWEMSLRRRFPSARVLVRRGKTGATRWHRLLAQHGRLVTGLPESIRYLIGTCLKVDPTRRPHSSDIYLQLVDFANEIDSGAHVAPHPLRNVAEADEHGVSECLEQLTPVLSSTASTSSQDLRIRRRFSC